MPKISGAILKLTPIPLPCLDEIKAINQELDSKLTVLEQFETDCNLSIKRAEMLRQSILKKAFSGQLVPQDPNDEPASQLLARIQAEKRDREAQLKAKTKASKKTRKSQKAK